MMTWQYIAIMVRESLDKAMIIEYTIKVKLDKIEEKKHARGIISFINTFILSRSYKTKGKHKWCSLRMSKYNYCQYGSATSSQKNNESINRDFVATAN